MAHNRHVAPSRLKALQPPPGRRPISQPSDPPSDALALRLGAAVERNHFGEHLVVRRWLSEPSPFPPDLGALRLLAPHLPCQAAAAEQWLFLDTETTGLAGGTGTYPFLVGIAWWESGGFQIEQLFMRDHSEEHSVLLALRERLAERPVLITFNGKSFDWPLLETRFRLTRSLVPRPLLAHLDLLHPARQLWRSRLGATRLADLEKHVLGWERGEDLPSPWIPQIYFAFLRGGSSEALVPVFRHNQMDLCGLAALSRRILSLLENPENSRCHALDLFGLSRIFGRRGQHARARALYLRALDGDLPDEVSRTARFELAQLAKQDGDYALAASLWEELCEDEMAAATELAKSLVELAIHYEHRERDLERAAAVTEYALARLGEGVGKGQMPVHRYQTSRLRLLHRLTRLKRKSGRTRRPSPPPLGLRAARMPRAGETPGPWPDSGSVPEGR